LSDHAAKLKMYHARIAKRAEQFGFKAVGSICTGAVALTTPRRVYVFSGAQVEAFLDGIEYARREGV
jgi:hypothetical protein